MSESVSVARFYTFTISKLLAVFCVTKVHIPEKLAAKAGEPRCTWRIYVSGVTLHLYQWAVGQKRWGRSACPATAEEQISGLGLFRLVIAVLRLLPEH